MKCRNCGERLKITNTYTGEYAKTAKAVCNNCYTIDTLVTLSLSGGKNKKGAKAWLSKIDKADLEESLGFLHKTESSEGVPD